MGQLDPQMLLTSMESDDAGVLLVAIGLGESRLASHPELLAGLERTARHDDPRVVMHTALALGQSEDSRAGEILAEIAAHARLDSWLVRAISSSAKPHAATMLDRLLQTSDDAANPIPSELITNLLVTLRESGVDIVQRYGDVFANHDSNFLSQLKLAGSFTSALGADNSRQAASMFQPLYARAVSRLSDPDSGEQVRCEALQLIGIGIVPSERDTELLLDLLAPTVPVSVQQAAIDRIAAFADANGIDQLLQKWPSMSKSVRDHCVSRVLERRQWAEKLLDALEQGTIRVSDLSPSVRQQLSQMGSQSMRVRAERLTRMGTSEEKRALIEGYLAAINHSGDATRGAEAFKQHCAVCHIANSQGQPIGASLNNLTDRSHQALLTAILDPNRAVDPKYLSYLIRTDDDRILVGSIEEEAGQSITLAHADGKRTTIRRLEIAEMKNSGVSLMPEGLQTVLSPEIMGDLLRYLQTMPEANP
jgi:putative heme-binding domain-containing protein